MKKSLIGVVAALMTCQTAFAADVYQEPAPAFVDQAPEVQVQQASGWYLRGDVGYSFNKSRGAEYTRFDSGSPVNYSFGNRSVEDNFLYGAGVGYQINNYLRTDLTFDYMAKSKFSANGPLINNVDSAVRAYSLMANAYVDLGTYGRITPYLGAGIGGAHVKWDKVSSCGNCEIEGEGNWRFAYALMAGASIDVTCNLKADVGYRFRQIGSGSMFGTSGSGLTSAGRDKGLTSHEVRVGGRYVFNGCDTAQYIPPADIPLQPAVYK
ncbi:outer membrane beta-barrel protein [Agrobacterium rosae]|uniref:Porin family protein n=1 Tax=Agrobacterium rosae TaxID=1972867 RepID=A0AAE5VR79_9HYPH|nr:outer membrane protein [Agrobacterium rosae]KAA3513115.1 porin family protein [Agrobacterium rosae]KAA3521396.1 porin family protein [Agrobacterium rosae]MCM2432752.1 porin family protein [Agrobacterium rosae]MDX8328177.1 porin family protein [Agrobacterium rosae]MQB48292.1 porin family protein [Agrobacterium rosae]